ncbi:MAG TPA: septal ring lytic transglycosylase RlpA family protein [Mycobacteriales bacterium]|nr:septal ring lytic transglycosylase RlpA family protein [Mycobacteriales bacterium]
MIIPIGDLKRWSEPVDALLVTSATPRALRRLTACAAAVALGVVAAAAPAAGARHSTPPRAGTDRASAQAASPADLAALRQELAAATAEVEQLSADVFAAAARSAHLRRAMDQLADRQDDARAALDRRIRDLYMRGRSDPVAGLVARLNNPDLAYLMRAGGLVEVRSDAELVAGVVAESAEVTALRARADVLRRDLLARTRPVLAAQERARVVLARAEAAAAADAAALAEIAVRRKALDEVSRGITIAVAPAVTARGRRATAAEGPVIAEIERTCCAMPPGYRSTGRTIEGIASWYGPGFVGNPTATGAPYDPERLTAAMLAVPLGTVVRVTADDGSVVVVLVNDRGPYVSGRVIDLSRAGARRLGFTGLRRVTVEVLEPV